MTLSWTEKLHTPYNQTEMWFCVILIVLLMIKEHYREKIPTKNTPVFFILFLSTIILTYFLGVVTENQFIYFQF